MVEVNCETDFVARLKIFAPLPETLQMQARRPHISDDIPEDTIKDLKPRQL